MPVDVERKFLVLRDDSKVGALIKTCESRGRRLPGPNTCYFISKAHPNSCGSTNN
jgi:hypothetical protein